MLDCERCGGPRTNGAPVRRQPHKEPKTGENIRIIVSPGDQPVVFWCRACIRYALGQQDDDPAEKRNTTEG